MLSAKVFLTNNKFMLVLSVVALVGVMVVWGLKATLIEEPAGGAIKIEATHYPLKLTMILNKTTFKVGEPVNIRFLLENIGNETLTLCFSDGADFPVFVVYDEGGSQVYDRRKDLFFHPVYLPIDLPSGLSNGVVDTWYPQLASGIYRIVGVYSGRLGFMLGFTIETEPITITIVS